MPPLRLPRHLRPCRPLWSAHQARFASDKPSSRRLPAGDDDGGQRARSPGQKSGHEGGGRGTRRTGAEAVPASKPELRIRRQLVSKEAVRIRGAMTTYLQKKDELQRARQSGSPTGTEDALRQRVKTLEEQLSLLLQKLQTSNPPSTEQPPHTERATTGDVKAVDAVDAVDATSRESAPSKPEDTSMRTSDKAAPRDPENLTQKNTSRKPKRKRVPRPPIDAAESDGVAGKPHSMAPRDKQERTLPNSSSSSSSGSGSISISISTATVEAGKGDINKGASQSPYGSLNESAHGSMNESGAEFTNESADGRSTSIKSSSHPQSARSALQATPTASDQVTEQSLLDELFPEASKHVQPDVPERRPSPPKLDLPSTGANVRILMTPSDARTARQKAIDAFRARGEQTTVLQLSNCSTALTESDFRRLIPRGLHIETWSRDGEFYKVIPGRDPLSLERLPMYYLLFHSSESALVYQKNASRLSKLSALHAPSSIHSAIMPPAGFLEDGEDIHAVTSAFTLHPQGHQLDLRTMMQPYNRALRALIAAGGYAPIVPNVDADGKRIHRVLVHIDGYEPSHWDLWQIISRHAHARGILWPFRNEHAGALRRLRDCINLKTTASRSKFQAVSTANPQAAKPSSIDYEDPQISFYLGNTASTEHAQDQSSSSQEVSQLVMNRVYNRWIVEFDDEDAARRFAGLWHRVVLPDAKDRKGAWKEAEEERWVEAEYLW